MYSYYQGTDCYDINSHYLTHVINEKDCVTNYITVFSLANNVRDENEIDIGEYINSFVVLFLIVLVRYFRKLQIEFAVDCEEREPTPEDFTLVVRNIPKDALKETDIALEIKKFFTKNGIEKGTVNIKKVNLCYDFREIIFLKAKIGEKIKEKQRYLKLKHNGKVIDENVFKKVDEEIVNLENEFDKLDKSFQNAKSTKFTEVAFITFNTEHGNIYILYIIYKYLQEKTAVLNNWSTTQYQRFIGKFQGTMKNKWLGQILHVESAGEPSEILWENQAISVPLKWTNRIITFLGTLILLAGSFALILHLQLIQV